MNRLISLSILKLGESYVSSLRQIGGCPQTNNSRVEEIVCNKKEDPCKKKEDPCKKKKEDPCKKKDPCKKEDPCKKKDPCKKEDPCKKKDPCNGEKKETECNKRSMPTAPRCKNGKGKGKGGKAKK